MNYCERCHIWDDWGGRGCEICDRCPACLMDRFLGTSTDHDNDVDHETGVRSP